MEQNNKMRWIGAIAALLLAASQGAYAASNITINDGSGPYGFGSNPDSGVGEEDNETEPGTIRNQSWDLEAFVISGNYLYLIGGFDFANGQSGFASGDIFIGGTDVLTGADAAQYTHDYFVANSISTTANGYHTIDNGFHYDYAVSLDDFSNSGPNNTAVYGLDDNSTLRTGYYRLNDESNPFEYVSDATSTSATTMTYQTGLSDSQVNDLFGTGFLDLSGGSHNVVGIDLSFFSDSEADVHFTFGCGNDNILGEAGGNDLVPDGGATLLMLGFALTGLGFMGKKFRAA